MGLSSVICGLDDFSGDAATALIDGHNLGSTAYNGSVKGEFDSDETIGELTYTVSADFDQVAMPTGPAPPGTDPIAIHDSRSFPDYEPGVPKELQAKEQRLEIPSPRSEARLSGVIWRSWPERRDRK